MIPELSERIVSELHLNRYELIGLKDELTIGTSCEYPGLSEALCERVDKIFCSNEDMWDIYGTNFVLEADDLVYAIEEELAGRGLVAR